LRLTARPEDAVIIDAAEQGIASADPALQLMEEACCIAGGNSAKLGEAMSVFGDALRRLITAASACAARLDDESRERAHELALGPYGSGANGDVAWGGIMALVTASMDAAGEVVQGRLDSLIARAATW